MIIRLGTRSVHTHKIHRIDTLTSPLQGHDTTVYVYVPTTGRRMEVQVLFVSQPRRLPPYRAPCPTGTP